MERFYVDVIGYRVEWRPDAGNVYLTSGPDSLALHADPQVRSSASTLDHIGVLLARADDVDRWAEVVQARGAPIDASPKTHRDGCRSFYTRDPEGNRVQFLWHPVASTNAALDTPAFGSDPPSSGPER